jgi:hypothetical protein
MANIDQPASRRRRRRRPQAIGGPDGNAGAASGSERSNNDPAIVIPGVPSGNGQGGEVSARGAQRPENSQRPEKERERASEQPAGRDSDRGWRDLAGNSPSQVGVVGALRARDVARPRLSDYEAAERDLVIVRRDWQPPEGEKPATLR